MEIIDSIGEISVLLIEDNPGDQVIIQENLRAMEKNIDFEKASTLGFQILYSLVTQHKGPNQ